MSRKAGEIGPRMCRNPPSAGLRNPMPAGSAAARRRPRPRVPRSPSRRASRSPRRRCTSPRATRRSASRSSTGCGRRGCRRGDAATRGRPRRRCRSPVAVGAPSRRTGRGAAGRPLAGLAFRLGLRRRCREAREETAPALVPRPGATLPAANPAARRNSAEARSTGRKEEGASASIVMGLRSAATVGRVPAPPSMPRRSCTSRHGCGGGASSRTARPAHHVALSAAPASATLPGLGRSDPARPSAPPDEQQRQQPPHHGRDPQRRRQRPALPGRGLARPRRLAARARPRWPSPPTGSASCSWSAPRTRAASTSPSAPSSAASASPRTATASPSPG
jgi:hypothetical protein